MKAFILLCVATLALARIGDDCPENSRYNSCGTACPLTCDNYLNPPKFCILMCKPGCHCDEGYVKTRGGRCVEPKNCPQGADVALVDSGDVCDRPMDTGKCMGYYPSYYFDKEANECKGFIYTGCGGNGNTFWEKSSCEERCMGKVIPTVDPRDVCNQAVISGNCEGFNPKYFFDNEANECKRFIYSGCGGNGNNFWEKSDCEERCMGKGVVTVDPGDVCDQPVTSGNCKGFNPKYYFDNEANECKRFIYSGCGGNGNNFWEKSDCEELCMGKGNFQHFGDCTLPEDDIRLPRGGVYESCHGNHRENGVVTVDPGDVCDQPVTSGNCKGFNPKYYFDKEANECKSFIYTGCGGNGNNFLEKSDCEERCMNKEVVTVDPRDVCDQPVISGNCKGFNPKYYFDKEANECRGLYYTGCGGNGNNFWEKSDCEERCVNKE